MGHQRRNYNAYELQCRQLREQHRGPKGLLTNNSIFNLPFRIVEGYKENHTWCAYRQDINLLRSTQKWNAPLSIPCLLIRNPFPHKWPLVISPTVLITSYPFSYLPTRSCHFSSLKDTHSICLFTMMNEL